jgi:hypothetical protein
MSLAGCVIQWPPLAVLPPGSVEQPSPAAPTQESSDEDLQKLVAPIALYPDPLLADVLPASTFPDQIQAAAQWLQENPAPTDDQIAAQPWDASVQALVHYPSVLNYMSGEIEWTRSLGSAVSGEQPDVMAAVQDLRAQAYNDGTLRSTPEQLVEVVGDPVIYIIPVEPDVIYVPTYDPVLVYSQRHPITFDVRFVAGPWLVHGFDWDSHHIFYGDWHGGWVHDRYGWRRDPHWGPAFYHPWVRDDHRWGPGPHVDHYVFHHEMARGTFPHVDPRHRIEVRNLRDHGKLAGGGRDTRLDTRDPHQRTPVIPPNHGSTPPKFAQATQSQVKNVQPEGQNKPEKKKS